MATRPPYLLTLRMLLRLRSHAPALPDSGLTLLESLVAIVIVAITLATITPPIFLATATRIQSRRAEQANQIAQGEVDRIRTLVERQDYTLNTIPTAAGTDIQAVAAPGGVNPTLLMSAGQCGNTRYPPTNPTAPVPADQLIRVDVDGDCTPEYAMQVFRTQGCIPNEFASSVTPPAPFAFDIGVRVYSYTPGQSRGYGTQRASLKLTGGRNDLSVNDNRLNPLQTLYTRAVRPNSRSSMECATRDANPAPPPPPTPNP